MAPIKANTKSPPSMGNPGGGGGGGGNWLYAIETLKTVSKTKIIFFLNLTF